METQTQATTKISQDAFPINGTDYIEFYVGKRQAVCDVLSGHFRDEVGAVIFTTSINTATSK